MGRTTAPPPPNPSLRGLQNARGVSCAGCASNQGDEARPLLMSSGLPPGVLQHVWALSDLTTAGRLSPDEFAVCMKLVTLARQGISLPSALPPSWVPPSMRGRVATAAGALGSVPGSADPEIDKLLQALSAQQAKLADVHGKVANFQVCAAGRRA